MFIPLWIDLLLAMCAGCAWARVLSIDHSNEKKNIFYTCSTLLLFGLFTLLLALNLDGTSFALPWFTTVTPPVKAQPQQQPNRNISWGWVFCPMYVLGVLLFVVDYALVRQALECDDQALPDEPQVVPRPRRRMRQSTLPPAKSRSHGLRKRLLSWAEVK